MTDKMPVHYRNKLDEYLRQYGGRGIGKTKVLEELGRQFIGVDSGRDEDTLAVMRNIDGVISIQYTITIYRCHYCREPITTIVIDPNGYNWCGEKCGKY